MVPHFPTRRFLTRSRVRRLRTAGATGVVLGVIVVLSGPIAPPTTNELDLQAALGPPAAVSTDASTSSTAPSTSTTTVPPAPTTTVTTAKPAVPPTTRPSAPLAAPASFVPANRRYGVGYIVLDLTDTSRPTPAAGGQPQLPSRHLPTVVRYPVASSPAPGDVGGAAPATSSGPFPLIVFSAGFNSSPAVYAALLHTWASAGYVVAAPAFPLTTQGGPLDEQDVNNQPGDLSFVITSVLARDRTAGNTLSRLVDPAHIAATGHSDGGETVMGIATNSCCRDGRITAAVEMSGDERAFPGGAYFGGHTPPLLEIQGDHDPINDYSLATQIYAQAPAPKFLLTLLGGGHLEPFTTDTPHLVVVALCTIDFFDHYLKNGADGLPRLRADVVSAGNATLRYAA
jgi:dienelactone hydrolase